ncbi:ATP-binding protein [Chitinimonas viridis]|uniref:ATP-binding protein n=1 Tax=Chitinimonas viridis TaxID=664880 RepID=A0ABT8B9F3_9NEIS|nr:ATP-binding protein [Chitinimonas viridis]MDN3578276.1 ATP-binding protein [Chitinimonas viridis]
MYWFDRLDDATLRARATAHVIPISNLGASGIDEACEQLETAWREVFIPTDQHLEILRMLVDRAGRYARSRFPTFRAYNAWRDVVRLEPCDSPHIRCLTGLAGVGKSALAKAFVRACQLNSEQRFNILGHSLHIVPVQRVRVRRGLTATGILNELMSPLFDGGRKLDKLQYHVMDWLLATATSQIIVDEMQFLTPSDTATTRVTQILMQLGDLGPPLLYAANYSLGHKLKNECSSEQKNRLLIDPIVVHPPKPDSAEWRAVLSEMLSVSPNSFDLDHERDGAELHRLSFGLFRHVGRLLIQAYRVARHEEHAVTMSHVLKAFSSSEFTAYREEVEALHSLTVCDLHHKRKDLVCPFNDISSVYKTQPSKPSASPIPSESERAATLLESTLTPGQRQTLGKLREAPASSPSSQARAKVTPLRQPKPPLVSSLREGDDIFQSMLRTPRPKGGRNEPD